MKLLTNIFLGVLLLISTLSVAGQSEYDDCILKYLKGAKLDIAAHTIKQACIENYRNPGFTSKKKRAYNACILENLPGIESLQAVMEIKSACKRKYQ